ncbi:MAG: PaaI family thioesterase [Bacteroidota bacterium]
MIKAIQDYYDDDFSHCYGCGRLNPDGHQLKTYLKNNETISEYTPKNYHIAIEGFVYGGLLASLIDCHGTGSASIFYARENGIQIKKYNAPRFVTGNLNVNYLKPTPLQEKLLIKGVLKEITSRKVIISIDIIVNDVICVTGEVTAILLPDNFGKK